MTLQLLLVFDETEPPVGHVEADHREQGFTGWLDLLAVISRALEDGQPSVGATP